jgi:hypothetical protein
MSSGAQKSSRLLSGPGSSHVVRPDEAFSSRILRGRPRPRRGLRGRLFLERATPLPAGSRWTGPSLHDRGEALRRRNRSRARRPALRVRALPRRLGAAGERAAAAGAARASDAGLHGGGEDLPRRLVGRSNGAELRLRAVPRRRWCRHEPAARGSVEPTSGSVLEPVRQRQLRGDRLHGDRLSVRRVEGDVSAGLQVTPSRGNDRDAVETRGRIPTLSDAVR